MNTIQNNTNETINPTENLKTSGSSESRSEITKKNYSYLYLIRISKETEKAVSAVIPVYKTEDDKKVSTTISVWFPKALISIKGHSLRVANWMLEEKSKALKGWTFSTQQEG